MSALILAVALSTGAIGTPEVGGYATYYAFHEGQAAAARALRDAIGPDWRGTVVTVTSNGHAVRVRLTDYESSTRDGALIDLDSRDFAKLAPLWRGRIAVAVEWGGPAMTLPPTDAAPGPDLAYWMRLVA